MCSGPAPHVKHFSSWAVFAIGISTSPSHRLIASTSWPKLSLWPWLVQNPPHAHTFFFSRSLLSPRHSRFFSSLASFLFFSFFLLPPFNPTSFPTPFRVSACSRRADVVSIARFRWLFCFFCLLLVGWREENILLVLVVLRADSMSQHASRAELTVFGFATVEEWEKEINFSSKHCTKPSQQAYYRWNASRRVKEFCRLLLLLSYAIIFFFFLVLRCSFMPSRTTRVDSSTLRKLFSKRNQCNNNVEQCDVIFIMMAAERWR